VETGLIILGLVYIAMSIWAVAGLFLRARPPRRGS
jgi:hypothetical protein